MYPIGAVQCLWGYSLPIFCVLCLIKGAEVLLKVLRSCGLSAHAIRSQEISENQNLQKLFFLTSSHRSGMMLIRHDSTQSGTVTPQNWHYDTSETGIRSHIPS